MRRNATHFACAGLVLLGMLLLLALASVAALVGAEVWATAMQREREEQLLFVGDQYRRAIDAYWRASPGRVKTLPNSLEVLLEDDRFPMPVRHLRRLYRDPIDENADWGLIKVEGGVAGVYSTSTATPLKRRGFPLRYSQFEEAKEYAQWRFMVQTPGRPAAPPPARTPERQSGR